MRRLSMYLSTRGHRASRGLVCGVLLASLALAAACGGKADRRTEVVPTTDRPLVFEAPTIPAAAEAEATESESETPAAPAFPVPKEDAQLARMIVPAAKIDAPLQTKGVNARNEMEDPDNKDVVAWYNFTGRPGFGSNAVFSGHLDWFTGQQGVFWYVKDLKEGDEILLRLSDGMELKYQVTSSVVYPTATAPVAEIVGPTSKDSVTLITCEGAFDRKSQDYSHRRIVRAERVA